MKISKKKDGYHITAEGELTIYTAAETSRQFHESLAETVAVTIDLSHVTEIDTAGVQILLLLQRHQAIKGKSFRLVNPGPDVAEVLQLLQLQTLWSDA